VFSVQMTAIHKPVLYPLSYGFMAQASAANAIDSFSGLLVAFAQASAAADRAGYSSGLNP
jgi:hypothetical protein